jgi:aminotransferase class I and II
VPVLIGDAALCKQASDELLLRHRIYLQPLNYPTVPIGTERLRLTPSPLYDDVAMDELVTALQDVWARLSLPPPRRRSHLRERAARVGRSSPCRSDSAVPRFDNCVFQNPGGRHNARWS